MDKKELSKEEKREAEHAMKALVGVSEKAHSLAQEAEVYLDRLVKIGDGQTRRMGRTRHTILHELKRSAITMGNLELEDLIAE